MSLNDVYCNGYETIMKKFSKEQHSYAEAIANLRGMPLQWLLDAHGIFIPNNEFMLQQFGNGILEYDCYRNGQCIWWNALIFPVRGVNGLVAGIAGFFPFIYADTDESKENYYAYSSKEVFQKGRYLFFPKGDLFKAIEDKYLLIVDGLFDAISLCGNGYNAAALMGSNLTQEILMQLRFVENVIIVSDNDSAGYALFDKAKKHLHNAILLKHGKTKDADDALKSDYSEQFKAELDKTIKSCVFGTISSF